MKLFCDISEPVEAAAAKEWVLLSEDQIYVKEVDHTYVLTPKMHKEGTIYKLIEYENPASSMIFCNTKEEVRQVCTFLRIGCSAR